ncbi:hypothetical protein P7B02_14020 [Caulobacter segnis]|uniref:hypothetical protein n=1 Tax=Caulobacter segnis TaxID=88688 RepID=UPI00240F28E0|nr:hypothetical protein [Caulobacter segnis]MDG2522651.1 hypothetical protein [Caulobacter segnis]
MSRSVIAYANGVEVWAVSLPGVEGERFVVKDAQRTPVDWAFATQAEAMVKFDERVRLTQPGGAGTA